MSDTTANLPALPPPLAGEDIRRALADVDARLSAWAAAVANTQPTEAELVAAQPSASAPSAPSATAVAEPVVVAAPEQKVAEPVSKVAAPPPKIAATPAKVVESPKAAAASAKVAEAPVKTASTPAKASPAPSKVAAAPAPVAPEVKPEPPAAPAAPERSQREEDEALMASLDPETAQAIKVMRRLSFENKSVRQLLEEYEQSKQTQDSSEGRKKSWWSR